MKLKTILLALLLIGLYGCHQGNNIPTLTATIPPTPTNLPRWKIYETALLKATVGTDDGLCEWAILGVSDKEVYVYALCQACGTIETAMSVPAVIYLEENATIEKVTIPRDGALYPKDINDLFPAEIQDIIFTHGSSGLANMEHLEDRKISGGPPLIVVLGTPMP